MSGDETPDVFTPRVRSRSVGSPVSNICSFQVDLFPGVSYVAYALSDGCIIVQQVCPFSRSFPTTTPASLSCWHKGHHGGVYACMLHAHRPPHLPAWACPVCCVVNGGVTSPMHAVRRLCRGPTCLQVQAAAPAAHLQLHAPAQARCQASSCQCCISTSCQPTSTVRRRAWSG